jgi:hypothetical protein
MSTHQSTNNALVLRKEPINIITQGGEHYFQCQWTLQPTKKRYGVLSSYKMLKGCFSSPGCVLAALLDHYEHKRIDLGTYNTLVARVQKDTEPPAHLNPIPRAPHKKRLKQNGGDLSLDEFHKAYQHDEQVAELKGWEAVETYVANKKKVSERKRQARHKREQKAKQARGKRTRHTPHATRTRTRYTHTRRG